MKVFELVNALELAQKGNSITKVLFQKFDMEMNVFSVAKQYTENKALLCTLISKPKKWPNDGNTVVSLLPQMTVFFDDSIEVLLSFTDNYSDGSCIEYFFPIIDIVVIDDTFRLIAGDEILPFRIEEPPPEINGVT